MSHQGSTSERGRPECVKESRKIEQIQLEREEVELERAKLFRDGQALACERDRLLVEDLKQSTAVKGVVDIASNRIESARRNAEVLQKVGQCLHDMGKEVSEDLKKTVGEMLMKNVKLMDASEIALKPGKD